MHKKLTKVSKFLCSHFNIEDGILKKSNLFSILFFIFSIKVKTQQKYTKNNCLVYGDGAVTDQNESLSVYLKLTQYCKSTIFQQNILKVKNIEKAERSGLI